MRLIGVLKNALYSVSIYSLPAISAVDCRDPGTPTNGQRSLSSTTYNSVVTYTCDVGYTLQGSNSRTCQSNGQWSGSLPQCNRMLINGLFAVLISILMVSIAHSIIATCTNPIPGAQLYSASLLYVYCTAICASSCQNGGTCTAPNTCTCDVGWTGMQCETGG